MDQDNGLRVAKADFPEEGASRFVPAMMGAPPMMGAAAPGVSYGVGFGMPMDPARVAMMNPGFGQPMAFMGAPPGMAPMMPPQMMGDPRHGGNRGVGPATAEYARLCAMGLIQVSLAPLRLNP